jgi:hypothetical protein
MALIRSLFWFAVFVLSTFAFTVIFEHGVSDFTGNAEKELKVWQTQVNRWIEGKPMERKKDTSDKIGQ